jgi:hypothetical protein
MTPQRSENIPKPELILPKNESKNTTFSNHSENNQRRADWLTGRANYTS